MTTDIRSSGTDRKTNFFRRQRQRIEESLDHWLDLALEDSFPCSDPISSMRTD
jgi:hypothetical protein